MTANLSRQKRILQVSSSLEENSKQTHRDHVPSQTIPVPLNLADRRRLPPVHSLLPVALHFRGRLVLVLVIVGPRLLPLTNLLFGDLRHGGRGGRCRLPLNRALLSLLFAPLLLRLPDLLLGPLLLLKALDLRRSTRFREENNCDTIHFPPSSLHLGISQIPTVEQIERGIVRYFELNFIKFELFKFIPFSCKSFLDWRGKL